MARKILNHKALRKEAEAAQQAAEGTTSEAAVAKAPPKRKKRTKETPVERVKLYWGVYNQSMKCVAKYEYSQKRDAEKKAAALSDPGKSQHFIQKIREVIEQ